MEKISFIICSYNYPSISVCLNSILRQKYSGKKEIIIVDGGSSDKTLEVINSYKKKFKFIKVLHNKNRLPEGYGMGKWLGWKHASGKYVFIIDQDNELEGKNFILKMLEPFKKEKIFGCACRLKVDPKDNITNRYISLVGTDPFFAYRSLDGIINLKKIGIDKGNYLLIKINKKNILITGGNCFVYKKEHLEKFGGYIQDTQNIFNLINSGNDQIAILKNTFTHHLAVKGFFDFIKKKKKWAKAYQDKNKGKKLFSYIPGTKIEKRDFLINIIFIITIVPNIFIGLKKFIKTKETAWLLHPILTFITAFIYFFYTFLRNIFKN